MVAEYGENGIGKVRRKGALAPLWVSLIGSVWLSEVLEANVAEQQERGEFFLSFQPTSAFPDRGMALRKLHMAIYFSPLITSGGRPSKLPRTSILLSREGGFICKEHLFLPSTSHRFALTRSKESRGFARSFFRLRTALRSITSLSLSSLPPKPSEPVDSTFF